MELEQPKRLRPSEDNGVMDARGLRLGLHLPLPEEEVMVELGPAAVPDAGLLPRSRPFVPEAELGGQTQFYFRTLDYLE